MLTDTNCMYFCQLDPLRNEFCVSNWVFVCTKCTFKFSLIYLWKYLVNQGREVFFLCIGLSPAQILSSHMCRSYQPGLNFVLAFECVKSSRINKMAVNESTGHQCLVLKWNLAVGGCITCYFIMWKQGSWLDLCVLVLRAASLLSPQWIGGRSVCVGGYMVFHFFVVQA